MGSFIEKNESIIFRHIDFFGVIGSNFKSFLCFFLGILVSSGVSDNNTILSNKENIVRLIKNSFIYLVISCLFNKAYLNVKWLRFGLYFF